MVFDLDKGGRDLPRLTQQVVDRLSTAMATAYHASVEQAYQYLGISSMNGITDVHETVTEADFRTMLAYARSHHLARLAFWSINRDQPCPPNTDSGDTCSGIDQQQWDFTRIVAQYRP